MLHSLYSKLSFTLFALLCLIGILLVVLVRHSTEMYQQEVSQKLNSTLAGQIVNEYTLIDGDSADHASLEELFHILMVINPSIELYLLDPDGKILGFSAPPGKVIRSHVNLNQVNQYLSGDIRFPLTGDDPRNLQRQKVFSAARIPPRGELEGYLYIILGGEQYDNIVQLLQGSHILRTSSMILVAAMIIALGTGLYIFYRLTRRLSGLSGIMRQYADTSGGGNSKVRYDITSRDNDEIERLGMQFNKMADKLDAQMQERDRMDRMRRDLVANISHDLRTPITNLQGYLETLLIKKDTLSDQEKEHYLHIALEHSQRLTQLVSELFELAKLESCENILYDEPFSLVELLQDVSQKFQLRAADQNIQLLTDLGKNAPMVHGDIGLMQRVLENLIENALHHTPAGGHIRVSLEPNGGLVTVHVSDTGCGIPAGEQERIFERFYHLRAEHSHGPESTGLGLAIAKRILELHGSRIDVQSEVSRGTTFTFNMPALET